MALNISLTVNITAPVAFFEESIPYQFIHAAANNNMDVNQFINSSLTSLMDYDAIHKTDFTHTLYLYLINERNISATVKQMFLHRNTLLYRIEKIEKILGKSLDDAGFRFNLLFSFYILYYQNKQYMYLPT